MTEGNEDWKYEGYTSKWTVPVFLKLNLCILYKLGIIYKEYMIVIEICDKQFAFMFYF